jgi:hypothetical protein
VKGFLPICKSSQNSEPAVACSLRVPIPAVSATLRRDALRVRPVTTDIPSVARSGILYSINLNIRGLLTQECVSCAPLRALVGNSMARKVGQIIVGSIEDWKPPFDRSNAHRMLNGT